jgi:hypothetical protein
MVGMSDEIDRKPIGDEEKDRVGEASSNDGSRGLQELEVYITVAEMGFGAAASCAARLNYKWCHSWSSLFLRYRFLI